jgi:hypothetical protein
MSSVKELKEWGIEKQSRPIAFWLIVKNFYPVKKQLEITIEAEIRDEAIIKRCLGETYAAVTSFWRSPIAPISPSSKLDKVSLTVKMASALEIVSYHFPTSALDFFYSSNSSSSSSSSRHGEKRVCFALLAASCTKEKSSRDFCPKIVGCLCSKMVILHLLLVQVDW